MSDRFAPHRQIRRPGNRSPIGWSISDDEPSVLATALHVVATPPAPCWFRLPAAAAGLSRPRARLRHAGRLRCDDGRCLAPLLPCQVAPVFPGGPGKTSSPDDFASLVGDLEERVFGALCYVVAPRTTPKYHRGVGQPEITQRDLRQRSREIMDAVEGGQSFTVTRDGHEIGELIPLRRRRRFVARDEFATMSHNAAILDVSAFRTDQAVALDHDAVDPYER